MRFLVSVLDDGQSYAAGKTDSATQAEQAAIEVFNNKLIADGYWVFAEGLAAPSASTVVDSRSGDTVITDGPFVETKEFMAGLWIWDVDDLDIALKLAAEASTACNRKIEVRPILAPPSE